MTKRKMCNFANASDETPVEGAIWQRGQYYTLLNIDRARDPRKYAIYLNGSLVGYTGSLWRAKRFTQILYTQFAFAERVEDLDTDKFKRAAKKYLTQQRPQMVTSQAKPKKPSKPKKASKPKKTSKKQITKGTDPIVEIIEQPDGTRIVQVLTKGRMNAKQRDAFIKQFKGTPNKKPTAEGFASGYTIIRDRYELDENTNSVISVIREEASQRLNNGDIKLLKELRKYRIVDELLNPSNGIQGRLF